MQFLVQIVVGNIIHDHQSILSVKANERRYMMTGVTDCQLEGEK